MMILEDAIVDTNTQTNRERQIGNMKEAENILVRLIGKNLVTENLLKKLHKIV